MAIAIDRRAVSSDAVPVRMVVFAMSMIAAILAVGILVLVYCGKTPDAALYTMAGGAIGSLGTLLSSTAPRAAPPAQMHGTTADPMVTAPAPNTQQDVNIAGQDAAVEVKDAKGGSE